MKKQTFDPGCFAELCDLVKDNLSGSSLHKRKQTDARLGDKRHF